MRLARIVLGWPVLIGALYAVGQAPAGTVAVGPIASAPGVPAVTWSPGLADDFPGCDPNQAGPVTAVVEVVDGWPRRVPFGDAWARTHDSDPGNHGRVVALCR